MFKRFEFEREAWEKLELMPMTVRRKLDVLGLKLHLEQWRMLSRAERLIICHFPVESGDERVALLDFVRETVKRRGGGELTPVAPSAPRVPPEAAEIPADAARMISELGLTEDAWQRFDADERYALGRLTRKGPDTFGAAWREIAGKLKN